MVGPPGRGRPTPFSAENASAEHPACRGDVDDLAQAGGVSSSSRPSLLAAAEAAVRFGTPSFL